MIRRGARAHTSEVNAINVAANAATPTCTRIHEVKEDREEDETKKTDY